MSRIFNAQEVSKLNQKIKEVKTQKKHNNFAQEKKVRNIYNKEEWSA